MSSRSNKKYYILLVLLLIVGISIGYAVLNTTLNITGKTSVTKNTWNVHFENVKITDGSVEATKVPAIENSTTVDFEVGLNLPGDYYEFTVDVVNDGSIDAMIDSVEKTPNLTETQQKYLNYIIEYQNGEQITTKQLVKSEEFVRLKVRVEFKKDISASDLPQTTEILTLGFNVNYVQSDGTGSSVIDNGVYFLDTIEPQGNVGTNGSVVYYYYDETTTILHIWGEGNMRNFSSVMSTPWYNKINYINKIKIYEGIKSIGNNAFYRASSVRQITFEGTMEQWNAITKGNYWSSGVGTSMVICSDGEVYLT